jgi:hypothetical protein
MKILVTYFQKYASGRVVLVTFVLTMGMYLLMLLYTIPKVESFAPGIPLFDLSPFGYSYQHASSLLAVLGEEGRSVYLYQQLPADFIYPGLFAISYSLLLTWLFAKGFNKESKIFYLAAVPVLGGLFDYLENISIITMIKSFPNLSQELVGIASTFTLLKSIFTTGFFLLLFVGIFAFLVSRIKQIAKVEYSE